MPASARQEAEAHHAIQNDHDGREYRVACDGFAAVRAGDHNRHDQRDLDDRHRDGKDNGSERLTDAQRHNFGMVNSSEDSSRQEEHSSKKHSTGVGRHGVGELYGKHKPCAQRHAPSPPRHPFFLFLLWRHLTLSIAGQASIAMRSLYYNGRDLAGARDRLQMMMSTAAVADAVALDGAAHQAVIETAAGPPYRSCQRW